MSEPERNPRFSDEEKRTLSAVLDEIIPPSDDGLLPAAGELGLVEHLEQRLRETPELGPVIAQGLVALHDMAVSRDPAGFAALGAQGRLDVLHEVATAQPAFVPSLTFHTYTGYYQHARVMRGLGLEPRPPHPAGYTMEPDDLAALLEPVRQRAKQ